LPPQLIKAFKSTLEDSIESDFLLHVIDASDPFVEERIAVVDDILDNIGAKQERILVFNKIDLVSPEKLEELKAKFTENTPLWISIQSEMGLDTVKDRIISNLNKSK
jgi:GTP-binding protein HflX